MRRRATLLLGILLAASNAAASDFGCGGDDTWSADAVAEQLRSAFPRFQFDEVRKSQVPCLYEISAGPNVLYYSPESGHLVIGEIWDKTGKNITEESRKALASKLIASIPLESAIKIGDGEHTVIEFADPDCPFCRKGSEFFNKRTDVTRYIYLFPLSIHPNARKKSLYILASNDPASMYEKAMNGELDGSELEIARNSETEAKKKLDEHMRVASLLGVKGTPRYWVDGVSVSGANIKKLEALLQQQNRRR